MATFVGRATVAVRLLSSRHESVDDIATVTGDLMSLGGASNRFPAIEFGWQGTYR